MIEIHIAEFYKICKNKQKLYLILTIFSLLMLISCVVLLSVFINYLNQNYFIYCGGLGIVLFTFLFTFLLVCFYLPYTRRCKHLYKIYYANRNLIVGKIYNIGSNIKVDKNAFGREITIMDKKETYIVYWDYEYTDCPLKVGDKVKVIEGSSFITSYEVIEHE